MQTTERCQHIGQGKKGPVPCAQYPAWEYAGALLCNAHAGKAALEDAVSNGIARRLSNG